MKNMKAEEFLNYFEQLLQVSDELTMDTEFRYLDEWSSLTGLSFTIDMGEKYSKTITPDEMKACETIEDLYNLYISK